MLRFQFEPYSVLAIIIFTTLFYTGINLLFFQGLNRSKKSSRFVLINLKNDFNRMLFNDKIEQEFIDSGFKISFVNHYKRYQLGRYSIFLIILYILVLKAFNSTISISTIFIICLIFFATSPKIKLGKHWTLFGHAMRFFNDEYKKKQDVELSSIIIQLQNIAISQRDEPTTLSHMLSRVVRFAKYTKIAFIKMISYLDQGREEQARNAFISEIDTSLGKDLAYILIELDRIEPSKVINQLKLLEDRVRKENLAHKNNTEEFYSNLMYIVPTALCFIILLNFLMIVLNLVTSNTIAF
ncbi:MAG TPA: hypothetical protein DC000_02595 [Clostridiales bacterium]|nr:hypothetical protein [Clostridiales bacterium]